MMADISTMMWKEWRELLQVRVNPRSSLLGLLMNLGIFGVYLPWQFGDDWLKSLWTTFWVLFIASFWTTSIIADSFAGERERHTLETVLASRLPNRAILFGKYAAALSYVCGQIFISLALGLVVVNLTHWSGQFVFYRPSVSLSTAGAGLLGAGLVAGLGILISLRAPTVRQAQQMLLIPITIVLILPSLATMVLPRDLQVRLFEWFLEADVTTLVLGVLAALTVIDVALLWAALARFQRARLILD
jgi:ABC-2 type transport system permease protein